MNNRIEESKEDKKEKMGSFKYYIHVLGKKIEISEKEYEYEIKDSFEEFEDSPEVSSKAEAAIEKERKTAYEQGRSEFTLIDELKVTVEYKENK